MTQINVTITLKLPNIKIVVIEILCPAGCSISSVFNHIQKILRPQLLITSTIFKDQNYRNKIEQDYQPKEGQQFFAVLEDDPAQSINVSQIKLNPQSIKIQKPKQIQNPNKSTIQTQKQLQNVKQSKNKQTKGGNSQNQNQKQWGQPVKEEMQNKNNTYQASRKQLPITNTPVQAVQAGCCGQACQIM